MDNENDFNADDQDDVFVSKTAVKKALQEFLSFGESLLELNTKQLEQLPLSEILSKEILIAKKLKNDNSRRRQLQRIIKIIRSENTEEIQAAYTKLQEQNRHHQLSIQPAEQWCQRLIEEPEAFADFINRHPDSNRQLLGQLIRNAKKEKSENAPTNKNQLRLHKVVQESLLNHISQSD